MKKLILTMVLALNMFAIGVGDIVEKLCFSCLNNILYCCTGHRFGVLYDPKTDKPFHCKIIKEGNFMRPDTIKIIKNPNIK